MFLFAWRLHSYYLPLKETYYYLPVWPVGYTRISGNNLSSVSWYEFEFKRTKKMKRNFCCPFISFMRRALEKLILYCSSYEVYNTPQLPRNGWLHVSKDADNETECEVTWSLDLSPVRQLSWKSCLNLTPSKGRTEWIKI